MMTCPACDGARTETHRIIANGGATLVPSPCGVCDGHGTITITHAWRLALAEADRVIERSEEVLEEAKRVVAKMRGLVEATR